MRASICLSFAMVLLAACGAETPVEPAGPAAEPAPVEETTAPDAQPETAPAVPAVEPDTEDADHAEPDHTGHSAEPHAGGEAHVHGGGDMAVVIEGNTVSIELEAPLANFGLAEAGGALMTDLAFATFLDEQDPLLSLDGAGDCGIPARGAEIHVHGDHGEGRISWDIDCAAPDALTGVTLTLFGVFPGFDNVDAIALIGAEQRAAELTAAAPTLSLQ